jgi:hypothetical protein
MLPLRYQKPTTVPVEAECLTPDALGKGEVLCWQAAEGGASR